MAANKAVEKTLKILQLIAKYPEGITLSGIYKELNMPKATVYDILQALYNDDAVYYKEPAKKNYVIGSKMFAIGEAYAKNSSFISFASPYLEDFSKKHNLTSFACKRIGDKLIYIYKYASQKAKINFEEIGVQLPLSKNAPGKTFLAFAASNQEELLKGILNKEYYGDATNSKYVELLAEIEEIKKKGYAIDNGTSEKYICTYAIPVFDFEDKMTGVIGTSKLALGENETELKEEINELIEIAKIVSFKQGYRI